jgi:heme-binding NEAT domain protein
MKQLRFRSVLLSSAFALMLAVSCKSKTETTTTTTGTGDTSTINYTAPVDTASNSNLEAGLQDALKDNPGVTGRVQNGEIHLKGTIEKDKWVSLNQTLMSLNPTKVVSDSLTIK